MYMRSEVDYSNASASMAADTGQKPTAPATAHG